MEGPECTSLGAGGRGLSMRLQAAGKKFWAKGAVTWEGTLRLLFHPVGGQDVQTVTDGVTGDHLLPPSSWPPQLQPL